MALIAGVQQVRFLERSVGPAGAPRRALVGLVVGRIHEGPTAGGDAIPERRGGVVHELRPDAERADRELALAELDDLDLRRQLLHRDREVRVVHLAAERGGEGAIDPGRPVHRQMRPGQERREEERQSLDVVGVGVADEEMRPHRASAREDDAELPRAGPAIEDEERPIVGPRFDARRITAVARGFFRALRA